MTFNALPGPSSVESSTTVESPPSSGKVYFEVPIDPSLPGPLRQKLSLAAYAKIQELDPEGIRGEWQKIGSVPTDPTKMPAFIRNQCLYALGPQSRVQDCLVTYDDPPATTYCWDETVRYCYHPFILVNPETGLPLGVHASYNGLEASADIQLVLVWESDPIFPAGSAFAEQALARFQAVEAESGNDDAVTAWPDTFATDRSAAPANGDTAGKKRTSGKRCWIDFTSGEELKCDVGDGTAADYTLMVVLRPGDDAGRCRILTVGDDDAGLSVAVQRGGDNWTVTGTHRTGDTSAQVSLELPVTSRYRVFTLQFAREEGLCAFVDDERVPRKAHFAPGPGTGVTGDLYIGCREEEGEPEVSVGEVLLFREPIWEEARLAIARYLLNNYDV
ncbi:MAG TPA: hypothetical protein VKU85_00450 [bacterium]|nr:hypothetical protein [bacterium]